MSYEFLTDNYRTGVVKQLRGCAVTFSNKMGHGWPILLSGNFNRNSTTIVVQKVRQPSIKCRLIIKEDWTEKSGPLSMDFKREKASYKYDNCIKTSRISVFLFLFIPPCFIIFLCYFYK
jgi:hypothetical protein